MADVTIDSSIASAIRRGPRALVTVGSSVVYAVGIDGDALMKYWKSTDGGATFGAAVQISATGAVQGYDCWFDQWTPGDSGGLIHFWYFGTGSSDVLYRTLDTASDTLGTERTVFNGASASSGEVFVWGAKARGGNLTCIFDIDEGTETGTYRSTDAGVTWGARTNALEAAGDFAFLFPGNEADNQDMWVAYLDASADELTLKTIDDSADTVGESSVIAGVVDASPATFPMSGAIRISDGHLLLAVITEFDTATGDFRFFDINGSGSITEKGAIASNTDDIYYPAVFVNSLSDAIYVAYNGKRDGSETINTTTGIYFVKSVDGGANWSAGDSAYSAGTGLYNRVWCAPSGSRFIASWRDANLSDLLTNFDNSEALVGVSLAGSQPASSGALTPKHALQHSSLAGAQAAAAGALAFRRLLTHVALAGSQASAAGALSAALGKFIPLAGLQQYDVGELTVRLALQHQSLAGAQAAAAGAVAEQWVLAHVTLAGLQASASGRVTADFIRFPVLLPAGRAMMARLGAGRARALRPGQ